MDKLPTDNDLEITNESSNSTLQPRIFHKSIRKKNVLLYDTANREQDPCAGFHNCEGGGWKKCIN